jgi:ABC-type cobalt transport system substrate-binding protein
VRACAAVSTYWLLTLIGKCLNKGAATKRPTLRGITCALCCRSLVTHIAHPQNNTFYNRMTQILMIDTSYYASSSVTLFSLSGCTDGVCAHPYSGTHTVAPDRLKAVAAGAHMCVFVTVYIPPAQCIYSLLYRVRACVCASSHDWHYRRHIWHDHFHATVVGSTQDTL